MCNGRPFIPVKEEDVSSWEEDLTAFEEIADNISEADTIPYTPDDGDIDMGPQYSITDQFYPERTKSDIFHMLQDPTLEIPEVLHLWNEYILTYDCDYRDIETVACQNCRNKRGVGSVYKSYHIIQRQSTFLAQINMDMQYDLGVYFCGYCHEFLLHVDDAYNSDLDMACCSDNIHTYFTMNSDFDSIISLI